MLDRFCAPLCEVVCQEEGETLTGQAFLSWLQASNLFLIPLDDRGEWFRFHHLFQNHLQNLLQRGLSHEERLAYHQQASRWLAENGWIEEAIQHALAAADTAAAVALVAQHRLQLMAEERWDRLENWIELFPDAIVESEPILLITVAHLPKTRDRDTEFFGTWNRAIHLVSVMPADSPSTTQLRGELASLSAVLATVLGPASEAIKNGAEAGALLPPEAQFQRAQAIGGRAIGYQMSGDYDRGVSTIGEARSDSGWIPSVQARLFSYLAFLSFFEGALDTVTHAAGKCVRLAESHRLWDTQTQGRYLLGVSHYLRNELKMAESQLTAVVEKPELAAPEYFAQAACALARIHVAQRHPEKAHEVLQLVISHLEVFGSKFSSEIPRAFQVELALAQDDVAFARRLALTVDFDRNRPIWFHYALQLTPIKLLLAEGTTKRLTDALSSLEPIDESVAALNRVQIRIDVLALQALVYEALGEEQMAGEKIRAALRLGERGGFIRNFVDLGSPMAGLLARLHEQGDTGMDAYFSQVLAAFQMEEQDTPAPDLKNPLTKRELQTLRLLATDLSPQEIASEMTVSHTTTRTHIRNVYQKLEVHSRFEAVQRARELSLL